MVIFRILESERLNKIYHLFWGGGGGGYAMKLVGSLFFNQILNPDP